MIISDGYIIAVENIDGQYNEILSIISQKPKDPEGYQYRLNAMTLRWELVKLPDESLYVEG